MSKPSLRILLTKGSDAYEARTRADITGVVVHRIEVSQEDPSFTDDPVEICPGEHLDLPWLRDAVAIAISKTQRALYRFVW